MFIKFKKKRKKKQDTRTEMFVKLTSNINGAFSLFLFYAVYSVSLHTLS